MVLAECFSGETSQLNFIFTEFPPHIADNIL